MSVKRNKLLYNTLENTIRGMTGAPRISENVRSASAERCRHDKLAESNPR